MPAGPTAGCPNLLLYNLRQLGQESQGNQLAISALKPNPLNRLSLSMPKCKTARYCSRVATRSALFCAYSRPRRIELNACPALLLLQKKRLGLRCAYRISGSTVRTFEHRDGTHMRGPWWVFIDRAYHRTCIHGR